MKLVIFANRADSASVGGLSSLLSDHINDINQEVFIIGWNGIISSERQIQVNQNNQDTYITTNFTQWEYEEGYLNFHNRFLWPLCHKFYDYSHWSKEGYKANIKISQLFLSIAEDKIDSNTIVIVQDYHLIPLGQMIKSKFNVKVGFYLHIPMFDNQNLQKFNDQYIQELIQQFKAYDYIGFQRAQDVNNLLTHVHGNRKQYNIQPYKLIDANGYRLCFNPVGINIAKFQNIIPDVGDQKLRFIFAGRYDYIKGHVQFLQCMYTLLEEQVLDYKNVSILLIGGESRGDIQEYRDYQNQIQGLINQINDKFGCVQELGKISRDRLAQILSSAENQYKQGGRQIVVCPSIIDGQNLIVHEAIASSLYNVVVTSIGSGCIDVIGKENILHLEQHDPTSFKIIILNAINISIDDQIRNNRNAIKRLQGQFNSSNWLSNIMSYLTRKTLIFDIDGTISDFVKNPNDASIHEEFFQFIDKTNHNIIILTGRENSSESNLTANQMLKNKIQNVVSDHGLIYQNGEEILEHPLIEQVKPTIKLIHREIGSVIQNSNLETKKIVIENKYLGVTINVSQESQENQSIILNTFSQTLNNIVDNQFTIANEHCSIESRPVFGKLEGYQYFLENKLKNDQIIFICDSLSQSGTDYHLANYLSLKGHQVWQVKNNKPDFVYAKKIFENPSQLCQYLIRNVI